MDSALQDSLKEASENLLLCLGQFLELLCAKRLNEARLNKFDELKLFPKLVVTCYIESDSRELFRQGVRILRSLLVNKTKKSREIILNIFFLEEETTGSQFAYQSEEGARVVPSVLDILDETLRESLHETRPADVVEAAQAQNSSPFLSVQANQQR